MNNLTIIYYTANTVNETFAQRIRDRLLETVQGIPIISVSHKPVPFGEANICCMDLGPPSIYNVYRQILIGTAIVETKYVACVEDDCLYTREHFDWRPPDDAFGYNHSRWRAYPDFYLFKHRRDVTAPGMWNCIAPTELMHKTLDIRFAKYPEKGSEVGWGEPGRYERQLDLPLVKAVKFRTEIPNITFAHRGSLGGVRRVGPEDIKQPELPHWGKATELWERMWRDEKLS